MTTETEPVPNPVAGDSDRVACKSKKGKGFRKPNTEPPPNRISERRLCPGGRTFIGQGLSLRGDGLYFWVRPESVIPGIWRNFRDAEKKSFVTFCITG